MRISHVFGLLALGAVGGWFANDWLEPEGSEGFADADAANVISDDKMPETVNPLLAFSGTSGYLYRDGRLRCHAELVSPSLVLTADHCINGGNVHDTTFRYIHEGEWQEVGFYDYDADVRSVWARANESYAEIAYGFPSFGSIGSDKQFIRLAERLDNDHEIPVLQNLDQIVWQQYLETDLLYTDIYYNNYMNPDEPQQVDCRLFSSPYINEIVFHDCLTRRGVSGVSLKSTDTNDVIAVNVGPTPDEVFDLDTFNLGEDLRRVAQEIGRQPKVASSMNSIVPFCEQHVIPCDIHGANEPERVDENGNVIISLRPNLRRLAP